MASSVVYSGVMGESLASLKAVTTKLVVFDTAVVDLSDQLGDPVEVLFSTQLGGGTDIERAVAYGQSLVTRPADTVMILISDLLEGGDRTATIRRLGSLVERGHAGVPARSVGRRDPAYDHEMAAACAALGAPAFACTPDRFPELLAKAIRKEDVGSWATAEGFVAGR
jgi:hypothetical protein